MRIYIIVVTYNAMHWIEKCLNHLIQSTINVIPIIIDNNSKDGTVAFVKEAFPTIKIIENKINYGFGKANNIGLKYALNENADYVFLLNQDAYLEKNTIEKLVVAHKDNSMFGIISPVHLNGSGEELDPNFSKLSKYESLNEFQMIKEQIIEYEFVNAAAWLLSFSAIKAVGGFDPLFDHYGEDRDYCNRLKFYSLKIGVATNAFVLHDRNYNSNNSFRKTKNLIFASGLAHLKNINHSLLFNYLSWYLKRIKKIVKLLLKLNFNLLLTEIELAIKFTFMFKKIRNSRTLSIKSEIPYLTN